MIRKKHAPDVIRGSCLIERSNPRQGFRLAAVPADGATLIP
jgi:hypothetical protein